MTEQGKARTMTLQALLERVEKAEGPDRELSRDLALAFGWSKVKIWATNINGSSEPATYWLAPGISADEVKEIEDEVRSSVSANMWAYDGPPMLTASIDAAVALVEKMLPTANWKVTRWSADEFSAVVVNPKIHEAEEMATPALALIAALLRALIAQEKTNA